MRAAFYTLGCKLNQFETEALASAFRSRGFFIAPWEEEADIYVINTCTVTGKSEQKARRMVRKIFAERPESLIVITGCYAKVEEGYLREAFPEAIVIPQDRKPALLHAVDRLDGGGSSVSVRREQLSAFLNERNEAPAGDPDGGRVFEYEPEDFQYHTRAFLKIQDGCDNRCAYCRVPLARGNAVGIDPELAVSRLRQIEARGYKETVLTGVNITAYRSDSTDLAALLGMLLKGTGDIRLRLSSLEPDMLSPGLLSVMSDPRIRPHFHLPIQSGSDGVLKLMKRKYTADTVKRGVGFLREIKQDPFIAADIIVGFPGESEEDFSRSRDLIAELDLAGLHVFQFSPRPGTAAEGMKPRVPERTAGERAKTLHRLADEGRKAYIGRWIGKTAEGIVLSRGEEGCKVLTDNYLHIDVPAKGHGSAEAGRVCRVRIISSENGGIHGSFVF